MESFHYSPSESYLRDQYSFNFNKGTPTETLPSTSDPEHYFSEYEAHEPQWPHMLQTETASQYDSGIDSPLSATSSTSSWFSPAITPAWPTSLPEPSIYKLEDNHLDMEWNSDSEQTLYPDFRSFPYLNSSNAQPQQLQIPLQADSQNPECFGSACVESTWPISSLLAHEDPSADEEGDSTTAPMQLQRTHATAPPYQNPPPLHQPKPQRPPAAILFQDQFDEEEHCEEQHPYFLETTASEPWIRLDQTAYRTPPPPLHVENASFLGYDHGGYQSYYVL